MTDFDVVEIALNGVYSTPFSMGNYAGAALRTSGVHVGTRIRFSATETPNGTYYPVDDEVSVIPVADTWLPIPLPASFPFDNLKVWFDDGAGVAQTQTAKITITLLKK